MNMKNPRVIVVLAAVITLLATSGCVPTRPQVRVGELPEPGPNLHVG